MARLTDRHTAFIPTRPFRTPHHTTSDAGLIGRGRIPMSGEVSLAHYGILFFGELSEFKRHPQRCCGSGSTMVVVMISRISDIPHHSHVIA
jgi:predicted ATPase with chaperone activity